MQTLHHDKLCTFTERSPVQTRCSNQISEEKPYFPTKSLQLKTAPFCSSSWSFSIWALISCLLNPSWLESSVLSVGKSSNCPGYNSQIRHCPIVYWMWKYCTFPHFPLLSDSATLNRQHVSRLFKCIESVLITKLFYENFYYPLFMPGFAAVWPRLYGRCTKWTNKM